MRERARMTLEGSGLLQRSEELLRFTPRLSIVSASPDRRLAAENDRLRRWVDDDGKLDDRPVLGNVLLREPGQPVGDPVDHQHWVDDEAAPESERESRLSDGG